MCPVLLDTSEIQVLTRFSLMPLSVTSIEKQVPHIDPHKQALFSTDILDETDSG